MNVIDYSVQRHAVAEEVIVLFRPGEDRQNADTMSQTGECGLVGTQSSKTLGEYPAYRGYLGGR